MASNKVGHFIYGLKDRIWLDFICHFSLYGPHHHFWSPVDSNSGWSADRELYNLVSRSPVAVKSNLNFLRNSAHLDGNDSLAELLKFGLIKVISSNHDSSVP